MLAVTPGTQIVTVGGAIANDVHGKNHHGFGSFGDHVLRLRLQRTDGEIIECGPHERPEWFAATVGGLGLTGVILEAELQLRPVPGPWLEAETLPFEDLPDFFRLSDESARSFEHSVSWIDCTAGNVGRGLFMRANPVVTDPDRPLPAKKRPLSMPLTPPVSLVNALSLRPFNTLYFNMGKRKAGERQIVHYEPFLYPLDNIHEWNRMYGPKGFYQYQSVVPREGGEATVRAMLDEIAASGNGSFLAVLKTFGDRRSVGMLGFPRSGITLALDFRNAGKSTEKLFTRLDAIIAEAGGAIYPAKGLVTRYAEGLQHRLAKTGVRVTLVKPGPTETPMTAHLKGAKLAPVADVAADIVKATERGQAVIYTPGKWRIIMTIIRLVPNFLFHKTNL